MRGGNGNDVLVWNNGDGSDTMDGDAGNDEIEVNGSANAGDDFRITPGANGRTTFDRVEPRPVQAGHARRAHDGERAGRR